MILLNEQNFNAILKENPKLLVLFYREKGCHHCDKFKPIFQKYSETSEEVCGMYALGDMPDSIATEELVKNFPTIVSYLNGQILKVEKGANVKLEEMFTPVVLPIEKTTLLDLLTQEAQLMDAIFPLKQHLLKIQEEIKKRKNV